jgi:DNA-binding transcriptional ArsR family regulator
MDDRRTADQLYMAIAHPARRQILELLLERSEVSAGELHAHFRTTPSATSQHLRVLREAALVAERREGRSILYRLTPEPLLEVAAWMQAFARSWQGRLDRLDDVLNEAAAGDAAGKEGMGPQERTKDTGTA